MTSLFFLFAAALAAPTPAPAGAEAPSTAEAPTPAELPPTEDLLDADAPAPEPPFFTYGCLGPGTKPERACRTLRWSSELPRPQGYTAHRQIRVAPVAVGSSLIAGSLLTRIAFTESSIALGGISFGGGPTPSEEHLRAGYVPVVGPWAALIADADQGWLSPTDQALHVVDGLVQAASLGLIVWGATDKRKVWKKDRPQLRGAGVAPKEDGVTITLQGSF